VGVLAPRQFGEDLLFHSWEVRPAAQEALVALLEPRQRLVRRIQRHIHERAVYGSREAARVGPKSHGLFAGRSLESAVMKRAILAALLVLIVPTANAEEGWTFSLTPYIWLPNINGQLKYAIPPGGVAGPEVDTGPNNYLENLSFALMLAGEARKDKLSIFTDLIYLD